ncbi:hypothetical protein D3C74_455390 [compost metagenome]
MNDVRCDLDRQTLRSFTNSLGQFTVGLMINEEHRSFGNFCRPPVDLYSVEAINRQSLVEGHVQHASHVPSLPLGNDNVSLDLA